MKLPLINFPVYGGENEIIGIILRNGFHLFSWLGYLRKNRETKRPILLKGGTNDHSASLASWIKSKPKAIPLNHFFYF